MACNAMQCDAAGFSPLGSSSYIQLAMDQGQGTGVLKHAAVVAIAARHRKSPAQVVLRWALQRGEVR